MKDDYPLSSNNKIIFTGLLFIFLIELIRTAWISDVANISLVTVLNFVHGYGPTFNIDERVQGYTHPIWLALLSAVTYAVRNIYLATYLLSISISLITFCLFLTKFSINTLRTIVLACALILSKSFVDFSTSGLEYPLSNLLLISLVLFAIKATSLKTKTSVFGYFLCFSLLYLCRADLILLILPLTLFIISYHFRTPSILICSVLLGVLPIIAWTIFSLYYYGLLFSNPTYAWLGIETPISERITQGIIYLIDAVNTDPLTISSIFLSLIIGLRSGVFNSMLSVGIAIYLIYIVLIGGDFMTGRLLSAPFFLSIILLSRVNFNKLQLIILAIGIGIFSTMSIQSTIFSNASFNNKKINHNGIADERGYYFQNFGLLNFDRALFLPTPWSLVFDNLQVFCNHIGQHALLSGPGAHYIDACALTDPLLSHLFVEKAGTQWRIGNAVRTLPENYKTSIALNTNSLTDPQLHDYYDSIRIITRGNLNDHHRWKEIIRINFEKPYIIKTSPQKNQAKVNDE